jgi:hypothetical protein
MLKATATNNNNELYTVILSLLLNPPNNKHIAETIYTNANIKDKSKKSR